MHKSIKNLQMEDGLMLFTVVCPALSEFRFGSFSLRKL